MRRLPASAQLSHRPDSLTQPGRRGATRCASCHSPRLTQIGMVLTDGSVVDFASCHDCEHKTWLQQGTALALDAVLAKAHPRR